MISDPGDSVFHYGLFDPPTVEEYIEKLRTDWADHIFVFAGGADPGGSLFPFVPLELDTWTPIQPCASAVAMTDGFLLMRDYYPLGAVPEDCCGDETIPWPDSMHYPMGYPIDGNAYREEQYALWPIDGYMNAICNDPNFSMRVRVTDHVGNWKRSGMIEDMQIGVEGVDSGADIEFLAFYKESDGLPQYFYNYCEDDCDTPQLCDSEDVIASSIEMRDINGECTLHLVTRCTVLKGESLPYAINATFTSNEHYTPDGSSSTLEIFMMPASPQVSAKFDEIIGTIQTSLCVTAYYVCDIIITDNPDENGKLFISHSDEAYPGYPFSDVCEDYTILYDPEPLGENDTIMRRAQEYVYGYKRGEGLECDQDQNSFYSEDRYIQYGGIHTVFAVVDDHLAAKPVQSAADLLIVASHGLSADNNEDGGDHPTGIMHSFRNIQEGCLCPPLNQEVGGFQFLDISNLSPLLAQVVHNGNILWYDDDFNNNALGDKSDNGDFNGEFWKLQPGGVDAYTWILLLGCDAFSSDSVFGYTAEMAWRNRIVDGHTDVICGYKGRSPAYMKVIDAIGREFSEIIRMDEAKYPGYYVGPPPGGFSYRPIRAWMEAHCRLLNTKWWWWRQDKYKKDRLACSLAEAHDVDGKWVIRKLENSGYRIFWYDY